MRTIVIPNRVMEMQDGSKVDSPDAPVVFKATRNADGTWTATVPDEK